MAAVTVVVAIGTVAHAQTDQGEFDPYSQSAKIGEKFDSYQQGTKADDKFDPYSQGASKNDSITSALNPGAQPANAGKDKCDTYTQDAKTDDKFDPYNRGMKVGGKLDPCSEGANKKDVPKQ